MGSAARVSLVGGWFPHVVVALALATLTVGVMSARGRWRRLGCLALCDAAGMAVVAMLTPRLGLVDFTYPQSFYVWTGLVVFAAGVVAVGWRRSGWWRRVVAVAAVGVTFLMAATLINQHYAYFPTPAAVFGQVAVDEVPASHVVALMRDAPSGFRDHGAVITVDLPAHRSGFAHRDAVVYLPPVWFTSPRPTLPVIMVLTGTPSLVSDWTRAAHADQIADAYAASHHGWAPILVFPDPNGSDLGDTECVDSPQGHAESYLTDDVPADVVAQFGSAPAPWAVAGLSEGGMCAALLTLRRPDVFSAFADFSGEPGPVVGHNKAATMRLLFAGSKDAWRDHDPLTLLTRRRYDGLAAWFEVGANDRGPLAGAKRLEAAASAAGMTTHLVVRSGRHNFIFWSDAFRHALPWLVAHLAGDESVASGP